MPIRRRLAVATSVSVLAVLGTVGLASANAAPEPGHRTTVRAGAVTKPTVVLEHGAWADSSSWDGVIDRLTRDGYPVIAAPDPLRGVAQDAATLRGLLATIDGPVVLVGHSYGGAVITEAATGDAKVKALVYVAAFAPDAGESIGSLAARPVADPAPALPIVPVPTTNPDGSTTVEVYLDRTTFRDTFAADTSAKVAARLAATQRPIAASALGDEITQPAWKKIPSWFLVAKDDRAISPNLERFMAARAGSHVVEIDSSHAAPVSHPAAVSRLIESAARATH